VSEALEWSSNSGDVLGRFSIRTNIAVWHMDTGDRERARAAFERLLTTASKSKARRPRLELAVNLGELAIVDGDFEAAQVEYGSAMEMLTIGMPHYVRSYVMAGLGLSHLKLGRLKHAMEIRETLATPPLAWQNDHSLWVTFFSELDAALGRWDVGCQLLGEHERQIRTRLPVLWVKLRLARVRLLRRRSNKRLAIELATEGRDRCVELGLSHRTSEFERLLATL